MRFVMIALMIAGVGLSLSVVGCAKNASEKRAASPTVAERLMQDSVIGKVHDIGVKHVSIRDDAGEIRRVRVDDQTKMDQVSIGDRVKAYVSDDGYASTIHRVLH
jgi:hypothetical protein